MQIYQLLGLFYGEKVLFNTNIPQYNLVKQHSSEPQYFTLHIEIILNILPKNS